MVCLLYFLLLQAQKSQNIVKLYYFFSEQSAGKQPFCNTATAIQHLSITTLSKWNWLFLKLAIFKLNVGC